MTNAMCIIGLIVEIHNRTVYRDVGNGTFIPKKEVICKKIAMNMQEKEK